MRLFLYMLPSLIMFVGAVIYAVVSHPHNAGTLLFILAGALLLDVAWKAEARERTAGSP